MSTTSAPATSTERDRSIAYLTRTISRYEHDRDTTDTSTETGLAHVAVLDMTIANWKHRLEATLAAA
ncbi:hypothetical protein NY551_18870 [Curtobacterium flaccumfaciens pv. oortii]|uniref:hypothetical protein n=1 Tax=Curtobacterium flaccumfaciens TaxID=2035 RepID=UPI002658E198|nr:hypothetical protein [Curtobacterium flaccumfaciens]MCS5524803.1 hypothetical protein [Curtobacterium flaccumfaciens pv. oortii]